MNLGGIIQQIDIDKLVLGIFGAAGVMFAVATCVYNPAPGIIGVILISIGIRIKIHMG
jgi:hypothetical protein